jgi:hypothetical protein
VSCRVKTWEKIVSHVHLAYKFSAHNCYVNGCAITTEEQGNAINIILMVVATLCEVSVLLVSIFSFLFYVH